MVINQPICLLIMPIEEKSQLVCWSIMSVDTSVDIPVDFVTILCQLITLNWCQNWSFQVVCGWCCQLMYVVTCQLIIWTGASSQLCQLIMSGWPCQLIMSYQCNVFVMTISSIGLYSPQAAAALVCYISVKCQCSCTLGSLSLVRFIVCLSPIVTIVWCLFGDQQISKSHDT